MSAISKSYRVRITAAGEHFGKTGVIAKQRPDDEPFGNPPQRRVRAPRRFYVVDFDTKVELGWFAKWQLEPCVRCPDDTPEHIVKAGQRGADLLLGKVRS